MVSPSYFPAIAAVELGCFRKEGLEAAVELLFPVTKTYEALRDGRLDFVGGAAHAPLYAFRAWTGCKLLCALSQNMYWFLDRIATHILAFEGDSRTSFFAGNYQEYEADKVKRLGEEAAKPRRIRYKPLKR